VYFDRSALQAQAKSGSLPALMRGLVRVPKNRGPAGDSLATRLSAVPEAEREGFVLDFVRGHVAAVLGHDSAAAIEPETAFKDLGFDSLAAVELRNRLVEATGTRLPATMAFDYPSAKALTQHLMATVSASGAARKTIVRAPSNSGSWSPRAATGSPGSPPIAVGTWSGSMTRIARPAPPA
jgi:acyl carrier protein